MSDFDNYTIISEAKVMWDALDVQDEPMKHDFKVMNDNSSSSNNCVVQQINNNLNILNLPNIDRKSKIIQNARIAFNLNKQLIEILQSTKEEVTVLLEHCKTNLELIENELYDKSRKPLVSRIPTAGMPYFKDKNCFSAPKNEDVRLKAARGELQIINLHRLYRWTTNDKKILVKAICEELLSKVLSSNDKDNENNDLIKNLPNIEDVTSNSNSFLPNSFKEMAGPLGSKQFDWLKISTIDFGGKHSAKVCSVIWNLFLHPDINKSKWSKVEDYKLRKIAENYRYQDWDNIAKELNTNRSGYQCFIRYNTNRNIAKETSGLWTKAEDRTLLAIVDQLKVGDYIPWGEVAMYMHTRTKHQLYFRWTYSLAPYLKKGRFTEEEDEILLKAVSKYGRNFTKISLSLMPHRSSIQLAHHYPTLIARKKGCTNTWTRKDDTKLFNLYKEFGSNWTTIAKHFSSKTRTQVRHRYNSIKKVQKGSCVLDFDFDENSPEETDNTISKRMFYDTTTVVDSFHDELDKIDRDLIDHFKFVEVENKSGRKKEHYTSVELRAYTQKLYSILTTLDVSLSIPKDFSDVPYLTEKDKQLLESLREYINKREEKILNKELVEERRLKMFGRTNDLDGKDHFIPPPPFGLRINKKIKQSNVIDYKYNLNEMHIIDLTMELETPQNIISVIGFTTDYQFDKLSVLLQTDKNEIETRPNTFVLQKQQYSDGIQNIGSIDNIKIISSINSKYFLDTIKANKMKSETHFVPALSVASSEKTNIQNNPNDTLISLKSHNENIVIEPSYTTLFGYNHLKFWVDLYFLDNKQEKSNSQLMRNVEETYNLLKMRLERLFKYPIGMLEISLLEIHGEDDIFDDTVPENTNNIVSLKRKRIKIKRVPTKKLKKKY